MMAFLTTRRELTIVSMMILGVLAKVVDSRNWTGFHPLVPLPEIRDIGTPIENIETVEYDFDVDDSSIKQKSSKKSNNQNSLINLIGRECQMMLNDDLCAKGNLTCKSRHVLLSAPNPQTKGICTRVDCRPDCHLNYQENVTTVQCPFDSYSIMKIIEENNQLCCLSSCACKVSFDQCEAYNSKACPYGGEYVKILEADGQPGQCCDLIKCKNAPKRECIHKNHVYSQNETWQTDDCQRCQCIDGVRKCDHINNCPLQYNCSAQSQNSDNSGHVDRPLGPDQCCLPCKDCVYPNRPNQYKHLETFLDPDCNKCVCQNNHVRCENTREFGSLKYCDLPCTDRQRRVWSQERCCAVCQCAINCPPKYRLIDGDNDNSGRCQCQPIDQPLTIDDPDLRFSFHPVMIESNQQQDGHLHFKELIAYAVSAFFLLGLLTFLTWILFRNRHKLLGTRMKHQSQLIAMVANNRNVDYSRVTTVDDHGDHLPKDGFKQPNIGTKDWIDDEKSKPKIEQQETNGTTTTTTSEIL